MQCAIKNIAQQPALDSCRQTWLVNDPTVLRLQLTASPSDRQSTDGRFCQQMMSGQSKRNISHTSVDLALYPQWDGKMNISFSFWAK